MDVEETGVGAPRVSTRVVVFSTSALSTGRQAA
jgi:hypothetical protein